MPNNYLRLTNDLVIMLFKWHIKASLVGVSDRMKCRPGQCVQPVGSCKTRPFI